MEKFKQNITTESVACRPADVATDYMLTIIAATYADVHTTNPVAPTYTKNDLLLRLINSHNNLRLQAIQGVCMPEGQLSSVSMACNGDEYLVVSAHFFVPMRPQ